jgi:methionyl-tRNA synthetase
MLVRFFFVLSLLFTVFNLSLLSIATDWSTPQLTKHKHEIESQLGNYFLRVASPKIFARSLLFSSDITNANGVTPVASEDESVSVWEGLPEDLKTLFITRALRSTTSDLPEDDSRESNDGVAVDENKNVDPNHTLLKMTLALEGKVDRHMERLEAGLALNEVMSVLKMVRISHLYDRVLFYAFSNNH